MKRRHDSVNGHIVFWLILFTLSLGTFSFLNHSMTVVSGESMADTYHDRDIVWVNRWNRTPKREDVVVVDRPADNERSKPYKIIKRVIGLPNEQVGMTFYGTKIVNENGHSHQMNESYIKESAHDLAVNPITNTVDPDKPTTTINGFEDVQAVFVYVPNGSYYVMGDNRPNSKDSREIGAVDADSIYGIVTHQIPRWLYIVIRFSLLFVTFCSLIFILDWIVTEIKGVH